MKEKRYGLANLSIYDRGTTRHKLEKMAREGWMIEKIGSLFWTYRPIEPKELHFEVVCFPNGSAYEPAPTEDEQQLEELCGRDGWKLALRSGQIQIYYNEQPDPVPIETDPLTQVENIHRTAKKGLACALLGQFVLGAYLLGLGLAQFWNNADWFFTQPGYLCNVILGTLILIFAAEQAIRYVCWHRKALRMAENGEVYEAHSNNAVQWMQVAVMLGVLLICFWGQKPVLLLTSCSIVLGAVIVEQIVFRIMKKRGVSRKVNKSVTVLATVLACMVLLGVGVTVTLRNRTPSDAETVVVDGRKVRVYSQEIPLHIQDYTEVPQVHWSTRRDGGGTFLAEQYQYSQWPVEPVKDGYALDYQITKSDFAWVLEQCKHTMLKKHCDRQATEENPWVDYYDPIDPAPWGAVEAYARMDHNGPQGTYLICYPEQLVELHLYLEPTASQMEKIGMILKEAD